MVAGVEETEMLAIERALAAGVVPPGRVAPLRVGRAAELEAIAADLARVERGEAAVRFVVGPVGAGKSFLLRAALETALDRGFAVARADLGADRRLAGAGGLVRALLGDLLCRLEVPGAAERGVGGLLDRAADPCAEHAPASHAAGRRPRARTTSRGRTKATGATSVSPSSRLSGRSKRPTPSPESARSGSNATALEARLEDLGGLPGGQDAARVLAAYARARASGDPDATLAARRWWGATLDSKAVARRTLGVGRIVGDESPWPHLELVAALARLAGCRGLVVALDEFVVLTHRLHDRASRERNHEALLQLVNAALQGDARGWMVLFGATDECVVDERRGLAAHDGLRSRLGIGAGAWGDAPGARPLVHLAPPGAEERRALLRTVAAALGTPDPDAASFLDEAARRLGADEAILPRDLVRDFVAWRASAGAVDRGQNRTAADAGWSGRAGDGSQSVADDLSSFVL